MRNERRAETITEIKMRKQKEALAKTKEEMLDTQDLAASIFEQNLDLQNQLLDTQELLAGILEGGVK